MALFALALDTSTPTLSAALVLLEGGVVSTLATREAPPPAVTSTVLVVEYTITLEASTPSSCSV